MFLKRWFDNKMGSVNEDTELKTKLVEAALSGMFAVEMPFPIPEWSVADVNEELLEAQTHLERIQIVKCYLSSEEFHKFVKNTVLEKDDSIVEMFIKKYEEFYSSSDNKMALRSLNLATLFATNEIVGEVYRLRSALLFESENWEDCRQDTELGLQMNYPKTVMEELRDRQLKCEKFGKCEKSEKPEVVAKHEFRENLLFQLHKGMNDKIHSASSVVEIRCDEKRGRGLFVTEDVEPGTTLLIEEPYVTNLNEGLNWVIKHCWRCLKIISTTIPCEGCVFAVYCSVRCRSEDAKLGHAYECPCLAYFHGAFIGPNVHLSYKTILRPGPEELFKLFKTSTLEEIHETKGIDPKRGVYDSTAYLSPLTSASHLENNGKLPELVWMALLFTELLDLKTNFFAQADDSEKEEFKDFVASLALFHNLSVPFNCLGLDEEVDGNESIGLLSSVTPEAKNICFAVGNYPLISLQNHGCDPNVNRSHLTNGTMVIMALRGLKAGEEMLFNYGFDYATSTLKQRQESLLKIYLFSCNCVACKYDFPLHKVLRERVNANDVKLRCPDCTNKFGYEQTQECALTEISGVGCGKCHACSKMFLLLPLFLELDARDSDLQLSRDFLLAGNPVPAIRLLTDYIKFIQKRVCQPCLEFCAAQRDLAMAYSMVMED